MLNLLLLLLLLLPGCRHPHTTHGAHDFVLESYRLREERPNLSGGSAAVTGEVCNPGVIALPLGMMPVMEALALAGGLSSAGDRGCIQVIRQDALAPKIYRLNWEQVTHLPKESLLLRPGDTLYIPRTLNLFRLS